MDKRMAHSPGQVFDSAAHYRIVFYGELLCDWASWPEDLDVAVISSSGGEHTTILSGRLRDQAALAGVLQMAYNMGVPLLSVQRLDEDAIG